MGCPQMMPTMTRPCRCQITRHARSQLNTETVVDVVKSTVDLYFLLKEFQMFHENH